MGIYLDACCLSRLTDEQGQPRVRAEAEAIEDGAQRCRDLGEQYRPECRGAERARNAEALLSFAQEVVVPTRASANRARDIEEFGISAFDALHLARAEQGNAEIFLTTDDHLLRRSRRSADHLHVRVENPGSWYTELQS